MVHEIGKTYRTRSNTTKTSVTESESISNLIIRNGYHPFKASNLCQRGPQFWPTFRIFLKIFEIDSAIRAPAVHGVSSFINRKIKYHPHNVPEEWVNIFMGKYSRLLKNGETVESGIDVVSMTL